MTKKKMMIRMSEGAGEAGRVVDMVYVCTYSVSGIEQRLSYHIARTVHANGSIYYNAIEYWPDIWYAQTHHIKTPRM
jgi:hypothetical protein